MATIGRKMAAWARQLTFGQLGDQTVHEVKRRVLDSIGTCLGAYWSPLGKITRAVAMSARDAGASNCGPIGTPKDVRGLAISLPDREESAASRISVP